MAARGSRPASLARGRPCRQCGADEWRQRKDGYWDCAECNRRSSRKYARGRREDASENLWLKARDRAREAGTTFTITVEDVRAVYPADGKCPALGIRLERGKKQSQDASPSLDRLNPLWGYEPGNIAVISQKANRGKNSLTADELEKLSLWMRAKGLN